MSKEYSGLPFRWLLPATQLTVCFFAMLPFRYELIGSLILASRAHTPPQSVVEHQHREAQAVPDIKIDLQPMTQVQARAEAKMNQLRWTPFALNLPSELVQMPYAVWGPTHQDWFPNGIDLDIWNMLTAPIIGILFWWIAGRGVEAMLAARQGALIPSITWMETLVGILVLLLGTFVCALFLTETDSGPRAWQVMSIGGAIWTFLGLTTISARIAQWRIRRRNRIDKSNPVNVLE